MATPAAGSSRGSSLDPAQGSPPADAAALKRIEREVRQHEAKARLALLWSVADLADWLRCTPKFCEIYGLFGLKKHDGWAGVLGVVVGIIGTFKVYRKVA